MSDDSFRVALTDGLRHERVVEHRQPLDAIGATLDVVPAPTSDEEAVERFSGYQGVILFAWALPACTRSTSCRTWWA